MNHGGALVAQLLSTARSELSPTNEEAVIFQVANCPPSQEIELKIHQEMSRDFLLRLERAVSDEGKGPRVLHLECSAYDEPVEPTFEFPTGQSLQIASIDYRAFMDFTKLKNFLKRGNPQLKSLVWQVTDPSTEEAEALLQALHEGSHQLRVVELHDVPPDSPALKRMSGPNFWTPSQSSTWNAASPAIRY